MLTTQAGRIARQESIQYYLGNASIIKQTFVNLGVPTFGADNAPYVWVYLGGDSWEWHMYILNVFGVLTTPGVGFGPAGQGYIRLTGFGNREKIIATCERLKTMNITPPHRTR